MEDDHMQVIVKDNGPGISEEHQEHIYDRFYQVESQRTRQFEGAGIGLSLTKELLMLLGGDIRLKSKIGEGSEFQLIVPIHKVYEDSDANQVSSIDLYMKSKSNSYASVNSHFKEKSREKERILIAEDNYDLIYYFNCLIMNFNFYLSHLTICMVKCIG